MSLKIKKISSYTKYYVLIGKKAIKYYNPIGKKATNYSQFESKKVYIQEWYYSLLLISADIII